MPNKDAEIEILENRLDTFKSIEKLNIETIERLTDKCLKIKELVNRRLKTVFGVELETLMAIKNLLNE